MARDWSPEERALLEVTPAAWQRTTKLTAEQVKAIRRRVDSLTMPWTLQELADEFGVGKEYISEIARRLGWNERIFEPETYWRTNDE